MSARVWSARLQLVTLCIVVLAAVLYCLANGACSLLTPDQQAYRLFAAERYEEAAQRFIDPMWKGVALFRQGQFKEAAGVFAGYDTADAAFNHGNALAMQGKYEEAAGRYARALELRPDWEPAKINREIALARAEMLKKEGGEMTGGKLEADEIVFTDKKSPPSAGEEQTEDGQEMTDAELRAVWLRQVQTKPADFLRAKFAYQYGRAKSER
jgi:Ca-activated chloride channel family protein